MADEQEISFDETPAEKVVGFFEKPIKDAVVAPTYGPEDVDNLAETPMAYKEVCEPLLKELYTVTEKRKAAEKHEKELKAEFKNLLGLDRGMIQRGAFGAKVTETNGAKHTDWQRAILSIKYWVIDQIAKDPKEAEAVKAKIDQLVAANQDPASPKLTITPYVVGGAVDETDT